MNRDFPGYVLFPPGCYIGPREISLKSLMWIVFTMVLTREITAQNIGPEPTRLEEIQSERLEKLENQAPDPPATAQHRFNFAKYLLQNTTFAVNGLGTG